MPRKPSVRPPAPDVSDLTLLVVGNGPLQDPLLRALHRRGLDVECVDPQQALDMSRAAVPDLVLLVGRAAMGGGQALVREFRADPELARSRLLVLAHAGLPQDDAVAMLDPAASAERLADIVLQVAHRLSMDPEGPASLQDLVSGEGGTAVREKPTQQAKLPARLNPPASEHGRHSSSTRALRASPVMAAPPPTAVPPLAVPPPAAILPQAAPPLAAPPPAAVSRAAAVKPTLMGMSALPWAVRPTDDAPLPAESAATPPVLPSKPASEPSLPMPTTVAAVTAPPSLPAASTPPTPARRSLKPTLMGMPKLDAALIAAAMRTNVKSDGGMALHRPPSPNSPESDGASRAPLTSLSALLAPHDEGMPRSARLDVGRRSPPPLQLQLEPDEEPTENRRPRGGGLSARKAHRQRMRAARENLDAGGLPADDLFELPQVSAASVPAPAPVSPTTTPTIEPPGIAALARVSAVAAGLRAKLPVARAHAGLRRQASAWPASLTALANASLLTKRAGVGLGAASALLLVLVLARGDGQRVTEVKTLAITARRSAPVPVALAAQPQKRERKAAAAERITQAPAAPPQAANATAEALPQADEGQDEKPSRLLRANEAVLQGHRMLKRGYLARAEVAYREALDAFPNYPRAMAGLVHVNLSRSNGPMAVQWAERLVRHKSRSATNQLLLGDAHRLNGTRAEATQAYRTAVRYGSRTAKQRMRALLRNDGTKSKAGRASKAAIKAGPSQPKRKAAGRRAGKGNKASHRARRRVPRRP